MKKLILFLFLGAVPNVIFAVEQVNLSPAYVVNPSSTTVLKVIYLALDWDTSTISIGLRQNDVRANFSYSGTTARNMMITLNKANLTNNSLHKRILNQLISDGYISGVISGSPD